MSENRRPETVVVLDLGGIELHSTPTATTATLAATGEFLGSRTPATGETPRESAARLLCDVLATTRLWRDGGWRRVVLYNPHTARMSVGAASGSLVLWAGGPLPLEEDGTVAQLADDALVVAGRTATAEEIDLEALQGALAAHAS